MFAHQGGGVQGGSCKCGQQQCPATKYPDGKCDVHGDPAPGRLFTMARFPEYAAAVQAARKAAGKPALDFSKAQPPKQWTRPPAGPPPPGVAAHAIKETPQLDEEEASLEDVLSQMATRWHTAGITE